jgi:hypothetical protein
MPRKFNNQDLVLPNGEVARIGTHMDSDGTISIKLRLPEDHWKVAQVFGAASGANYTGGKTVIILDRS